MKGRVKAQKLRARAGGGMDELAGRRCWKKWACWCLEDVYTDGVTALEKPPGAGVSEAGKLENPWVLRDRGVWGREGRMSLVPAPWERNSILSTLEVPQLFSLPVYSSVPNRP